MCCFLHYYDLPPDPTVHFSTTSANLSHTLTKRSSTVVSSTHNPKHSSETPFATQHGSENKHVPFQLP